jgi:SOS-response transcriptional repressor LexA
MNTKLPLSKRENEIWVYLLGYFVDHKYSPLKREIKEALKFSSIQQIDKCLKNMEKKRWIRFHAKKWKHRNIIDPKINEN